MDYHIAQVNIARMLDEIDSPLMAAFKTNLDPINALAERSPGFVWRFKDVGDDTTSTRVYEDPCMIITVSVWTNIDDLFRYVYYSPHTDYYRRRREWFEKLTPPVFALWWVPAGTEPTPLEAKARLEYLEQHGATPYAFTFKRRFTVDEWLAYAGNEAATEKVE